MHTSLGVVMRIVIELSCWPDTKSRVFQQPARAFRGFSPPPPRAHPIVVVAVSRGSSCRSERPGSRVRDGVALDSPGRGMRGALDYRIRILPLRSVPPSVGAGNG